MYCTKCGLKLEDRSRFCPYCGQQVIFSGPSSNAPPDRPLPSASATLWGMDVVNTFVWILALVPLVGTAVEWMLVVLFDVSTAATAVMFLILNGCLCYLDERALQQLGYPTERLGRTWLVPTYLYYRSRMLGHDDRFLIIWCVCFALIII